MNDFSRLYGEEYFADRCDGGDRNRTLSYYQEFSHIITYVSGGNVLDVGCGMGNFLSLFGQEWRKFGIEVSEYASEKAKERGVELISYDGKEAFFDLIVMRGVIQHMDTPLIALKSCLRMLRPGGYIVFLATPNTNSPYYKCFGTLPMLDPERNFLLPSDLMLTQILKNYGMLIEEVHYPYLSSPYSHPIRDHLKFLLKMMGINVHFPFWKNVMEIYARKPLVE